MKKMLNHFTSIDPDEERRVKFAFKVSHYQNRLQKLEEEIVRLETLHRQGNDRKISALEAVVILNKEIKELKEAQQLKMKCIQKLTSRTCWPKSFSSSSIVGDIPDGDSDQVDNELKPCSFCSKSFSKMDIVIGSCACLYHPWCIVTQCWISGSYANKRCKKNFTFVWMKSMGLANIDGKLITFFSRGLPFRV